MTAGGTRYPLFLFLCSAAYAYTRTYILQHKISHDFYSTDSTARLLLQVWTNTILPFIIIIHMISHDQRLQRMYLHHTYICGADDSDVRSGCIDGERLSVSKPCGDDGLWHFNSMPSQPIPVLLTFPSIAFFWCHSMLLLRIAIRAILCSFIHSLLPCSLVHTDW